MKGVGAWGNLCCCWEGGGGGPVGNRVAALREFMAALKVLTEGCDAAPAAMAMLLLELKEGPTTEPGWLLDMWPDPVLRLLGGDLICCNTKQLVTSKHDDVDSVLSP